MADDHPDLQRLLDTSYLDEAFDVTGLSLDPTGFRYGLGPEHFPALIEPRFHDADRARSWLQDDSPVLAVHIADATHVYPIELMLQHEVVNDVVGGQPIFAAYCVLAELGAVYHRRIGDATLTFAVSGYTYASPEGGPNAFVLWDRETRSLWWPPRGTAVSGPLRGRHLPVLAEELWAQTTWGAVRRTHPDARVLTPGQTVRTRVADWPRLAAEDLPPESPRPPPLAPVWGANDRLESTDD